MLWEKKNCEEDERGRRRGGKRSRGGEGGEEREGGEESGSREELEQRLYHFICKLLGQSACDPPNTGRRKVRK